MGSGDTQNKKQGKQSCITSYAEVIWGRVWVSSTNAASLSNTSLAPARCLNESAIPETHFLIASTLSGMLFLPSNRGCSLPSLKYVSFLTITHSCLLLLPQTSTAFRTAIGGSEPESLSTLAELMETRHQWVLHPLKGLQPVEINICEN